MKDLETYAEENGLTIVETTSDRGSYPKNLKHVLTGFDTFEDALLHAEINDGSVIEIYRKDGWQLWSRRGETINAINPMNIVNDDFSHITSNSYLNEEDFKKDRLLEMIDFMPLRDIMEIAENEAEIWEEYSDLEEDEMVLIDNGVYYDTVKVKCTEFNYDSQQWRIAVEF